MGATFLSVMLDFIMACLLLATIVYCLRLNKRIKVLQDSRSELAKIIREFDESTQRATQNINEIHAATTRISENIQLKIDKANFLVNDLEVMIERGSKMAGKGETPSVRPVPRSAPEMAPARSSEAPRMVTPDESAAADAARRPVRMRSRAAQELMNLLGKKKSGTGH